MIFRSVLDLRVGDAVRPFDERLWHVVAVLETTPSPAEPGYRRVVTFSHPRDGTIEVEVCLNDMVRLA